MDLRQWQPIETAPKDGTRFVGGCYHRSYGWIWSSCRFYQQRFRDNVWDCPGCAKESCDNCFDRYAHCRDCGEGQTDEELRLAANAKGFDFEPSEMSQTPEQERLSKFRADYFCAAPTDISQLAADGMIVVVDCEAELAALRAEVETLQQERDELLERLTETLIPSKGRCDKGHHPNFVYDLTSRGGIKGCRMCELETLRATCATLEASLSWALRQLRALVTEDDGNGAFIRGTGTELAGFGAEYDKAQKALRTVRSGAGEAQK